MRGPIIILTLIAGIFWTVSSYAQNDFAVWSGLEINGQISKNIKIGLETETRFDNNSSRLKTVFVAPYIDYTVHKLLKVGFNYRLSGVPYNSTYNHLKAAHRYTLDLELKNIIDLIKEKSKFGIEIRLRGTTELENQKQTENYIRFRIKADYNIPKSKMEPFLSAELFYHFNEQIVYTYDAVRTFNNVNKFRASMGVNFAIGKQHDIKLFTIYQRQLMNLENDFILGVGYAYSLKKQKDKRKKKTDQ